MKIRVTHAGGAIIAAIILLFGFLILSLATREKQTTTLRDGSVITLEKIETNSLWPEKFRIWLRDKWDLEDFLTNTLHWKSDWRFTNEVAYSPYKRVTVLEISLNPSERFKNLEKNPLSWLDAAGRDIVRFYGGVIFEHENGYLIPMEAGEHPGRIRLEFPTDNSEPIKEVIFSASRITGADTQAEISLLGKSETPAENPEPLPAEGILKTADANSEFSLQLDALPVLFKNNAGIKILKNDQDVTGDFHVSREMWPNTPEEHGKNRYVSFSAFPKSPASLPKDKFVSLPPETISEDGNVLEWNTKELNPAFPECRVMLFAPGAYCVFSNYDTGEMRVEIAAKNKAAGRAEFEKKIKKLSTQWKCSVDSMCGIETTLEDTENQFTPLKFSKPNHGGEYIFFETKVSILRVKPTPNSRKKLTRPPNSRLLIYEANSSNWTSVALEYSTGVEINKGKAKPGDVVKLTICDAPDLSATFNVIPAESDQRAWEAEDHRKAEAEKK